MNTRRITFRLYPSKAQEVKLHYYRRLHKDLYNACVYHRKTEYQKFGKNVTYLAQQNILPAFKQEWVEYKELGSQALQATVKRVDFAFQRFFAGLGKYPKFKSSRYYRGWTYPAGSGWKTHTTDDNGALELLGISGQIQMRGKGRTWGTPTTCTIVWKQNKWYASITVNCTPTRETGIGAIGLDIGTLTAVAMSDGTKIDNPRFLATAQKQINKVSKHLRRKRSPQKRKTKASRRWKKVRKQVSKLQNKVANRRQNWVHQVATEITSANSLVATEELAVKNMTAKAKKGKRKRQKTGLNRSILDVGFGMLRAAIKYKVIESGGVFVDVPTKKVKPSQTCPSCGIQKPKSLDERIHQCDCGCTLDRDVASAVVCLNYALGAGTVLKDGDGLALPKSPLSCGGFRQLNQMKRQKLSEA
jgi:putative transposase